MRDYRLTVFISSSMVELAPERNAVWAGIDASEMWRPFAYESDALVSSKGARENWEEMLAGADATIVLLWKKLGEWTKQEMEYSREQGLPVFVFIKQDETRPLEASEAAFLADLEDPNTGLTPKYFSSTDELVDAVERSLMSEIGARFRESIVSPDRKVKGNKRIATPTDTGTEVKEAKPSTVTRRNDRDYMADIFLSYAREDMAFAEELATVFDQRAWTVFWDRIVPPGGTWAEVLERELAAAGCVVVLWSKFSVKSDWVNVEASTARDRGVLIPALIEDVKAPLEFSRIQAADLSSWKPGGSDTELEALVGAIASKVGGMQASELQTPESTIETLGAPSGKSVGAAARIRELRGSKRADLEAVQFPLLGRNDRGEWVAALQTALESVGLELGTFAVDGVFGPDTEHAVRRFQSRHGLDVDGIVGPETWLEFLVS